MAEATGKVVHKVPPPPRGFFYYFRCLARRMPRLVNLEITKRCNARCGFCSCWQDESKDELEDYAPVIEKFRPVVVSVTGGEPLVRKNYAQILKNIRPYCHYLGMVTNGALLNEKSARVLMEAGVNHISVSLDYLGSKHDEMRQIPGLYDHLERTLPQLAAKGYRVVLNTVIMESNLDQILPIAYTAKEWGMDVSYSAYCPLKKDNEDQMVRSQRYTQLVQIIDELRGLKKVLRHIKNSNYYLKGVAPYFRDGGRPKCKAGFNWVQITPDGYVQQCSELPRVCYYTDYSQKKLKRSSCTRCWYTCRGEAEAHPLRPSRMVELIKA